MSFSGTNTLADSRLARKEEGAGKKIGRGVSDKRRLTKNKCDIEREKKEKEKVANSPDGQGWETMRVIWYKNHKYL